MRESGRGGRAGGNQREACVAVSWARGYVSTARPPRAAAHTAHLQLEEQTWIDLVWQSLGPGV